MKKKTLLLCSLLAFTVLISVVSAQAQDINSYRAHVPFDFVIGKHDYAAGDYVIRFESPNALATIFKLNSAEGRELQASAVMKNGNTSRTGMTMLVFSRYGDNYVLRQITSPTFGFWAPKVGTATWVTITKNLGKKPENVTVSLSR